MPPTVIVAFAASPLDAAPVPVDPEDDVPLKPPLAAPVDPEDAPLAVVVLVDAELFFSSASSFFSRARPEAGARLTAYSAARSPWRSLWAL